MISPTVNIGIFLLEDDPGDAELLRRLFEKNGITDYSIFNCSKGFIENMHENVFIAIIDHYLGYETTGLEVIDKLRGINDKCKVIIISGQKNPDVMMQYYKKKIEAYIDKNSPTFYSELIENINECKAYIQKLFNIFSTAIGKLKRDATDY